MEIFWIVAGVVIVVIYLINQNKTKTTDKTIVRQRDTFKTETGEVTIERTKVVDSSQATFTKPQPVQPSSSEVHIQAVAHGHAHNVGPDTSKAPIQSIVPNKPQAPVSSNTMRVESRETIESSKQCTRCRVKLPFSKFSKSSKHADGVTIWCTDCLKGDKNTKHMKWCPKCKIRRKRTSFYPNSQNADELMAWCKTCWDKHKNR